MKKLLCFLLCSFLLLTNKGTALEESFLIRRAYLELTNHIPTITEMEWYCVYNTNAYETAVDWLINTSNRKWKDVPDNYIKLILTSDNFKNSPKIKLSDEEIYQNLFYITGLKKEISESTIKEASKLLIKWAIESGNTETESIDYMCMALMNRCSNLEEINILTKILKDSIKSEDDTWLDILNTILTFDDARTK